MNRQGAAVGDIGVAKLLRVEIGRALDDDLGAGGLDLGDLQRRGDFRHENARLDAELARGA